MHSADAPETPASRVSMYWATLRRRWRLALAIVVAAVLAGGAVSALRPTSYDATAKVLIGQRAQLDALLGAGGYSPDPEREVNTELALVSMEPVAEDVRRRLGLSDSAGELLGKLSAQIDRNSQIVAITVNDSSARRAARIANAFALGFRALAGRWAQASLDEAVAAARERAARLPAGPDRDVLDAEVRRLEAASAFTTGGVQVIRRASAATAQPSGSGRTAVVAAGFLGLVIAAVTIVVLARTDDTVRDAEELEALLDMPLVGSVPGAFGPRSDTAGRDAFAGLALALAVGHSPFRNGARNGGGGVVLRVTSPGPGDAITSVALGLARAFGEMGRRTLAIEADLRSPRFAHQLSLDPAAGLAGILADGRTLGDEMIVLPLGAGRGVPGGDLRDGATAPLPLPLLAGPRMAAVIAEARRLASIVILAGSPTDEFADSLALAAQADAVLLVARVDGTSRAGLQRARMAFEQLDLHPAGVVAVADRPARGGARPARRPAAPPAAPANGAAHETPEVIAQ